MSIFGYLFYLLAISFDFFAIWYSVKGRFYRRYWWICAILITISLLLRLVGGLIDSTVDKEGFLHEPGFPLIALGALLTVIGIINAFVLSILSLYRYYNKK
jgi:hypothetical protein